MRKFIGLTLLPFFSLSHAASAPVEDLGPGEAPMTRSAPVSAAPAAGPQNQALTDLHFDVQSMRDDLRELRGLVEEQAHELRQLKQRQLDDYQDLDRRISAASAAGSAVPPTSAAGQRRPSSAPAGDDGFDDDVAFIGGGVSNIPSATQGRASGGESEAYTAAYNLLKAKKIDESVAAFKQFVAKFPNSQYTANAYYWLGEIYMLQNSLDEAGDAFGSVTEKFPAHRKANDAKFKLGKVYHLQGRTSEARALLNEVAATNSGAASLAKAYLNENF